MPAAIGWSFPSNNNGREDGLNDPGVETFRDDPLRSLSREAAQNSSDAPNPNSGKPVEIHFELSELPVAQFPDADRFQSILKSCETYWSQDQATRKFFKNAQKLMKQNTVRMLRVSDYNTTGLRGPVDDRTSDWFKLTKAVGSSDKAGGAGGSFGIGKHAPFACSELRTVLYGTKDINGGFAFQGVSKLVTHAGTNKETTQGTGYFGVRSKHKPITNSADVDKIFRRTKIGTDVFILGFIRDKDWADDIAKGLIESFFVSIHEGRLIAKVGSMLINKSSLPTLIEKYASHDEHWAPRAYYEALISEDGSFFFEEDFEGLGRVELRLLAGSDYPKRVAMVRSSGMLIYSKGHFQTPLRFAGVFVAKGEKLNALLKSVEPPSHDKWEDKRSDDPAYARSVLRSLNGWIQDKVRTLSDEHGLEELDAEGVSQYLPDDADDSDWQADSSSEGEPGEPIPDIAVQLRVHEKPSATASGQKETAGVVGDDEQTLGPGGGDWGEGTGEGGDDGGGEGTKDGGLGDGAGKGGTSAGPSPAPKAIGLRKVRVFCSDPARGRYRIMAEPQATGEGFLVVHVIGEVGQEPAPIQEIWLGGEKKFRTPTKPGTIGPLPLKSGKRITAEVVLADALHCALGVSAHAS